MNESLEAIALTFKVLFFANMTDMFGSVPYEEAFGREVGGTLLQNSIPRKEFMEFLFQGLEEAK
ncbi:MAG: SusD/RagB family nutrient-binding outer membrane lipoprotein [Bacteroidales bacterium]